MNKDINPLNTAYERIHGELPPGHSDVKIAKALIEGGDLNDNEKSSILEHIKNIMQFETIEEKRDLVDFAEGNLRQMA